MRIALFIPLLLLLSACAFSQPVVLEPTGDLNVSCPLGVVCDETYDYRAYSYADDDAYLYFSFGPEVVDNESLEAFREHFNYVNVQLLFPDRSDDDWEASYQNQDPIRNVTFGSFENGRLSGTFEFSIDEIAYRNLSPACEIQDVALPDCLRSESFGRDYQVRFNLSVPTEDLCLFSDEFSCKVDSLSFDRSENVHQTVLRVKNEGDTALYVKNVTFRGSQECYLGDFSFPVRPGQELPITRMSDACGIERSERGMVDVTYSTTAYDGPWVTDSAPMVFDVEQRDFLDATYCVNSYCYEGVRNAISMTVREGSYTFRFSNDVRATISATAFDPAELVVNGERITLPAGHGERVGELYVYAIEGNEEFVNVIVDAQGGIDLDGANWYGENAVFERDTMTFTFDACFSGNVTLGEFLDWRNKYRGSGEIAQLFIRSPSGISGYEPRFLDDIRNLQNGCTPVTMKIDDRYRSRFDVWNSLTVDIDLQGRMPGPKDDDLVRAVDTN